MGRIKQQLPGLRLELLEGLDSDGRVVFFDVLPDFGLGRMIAENHVQHVALKKQPAGSPHFMQMGNLAALIKGDDFVRLRQTEPLGKQGRKKCDFVLIEDRVALRFAPTHQRQGDGGTRAFDVQPFQHVGDVGVLEKRRMGKALAPAVL